MMNRPLSLHEQNIKSLRHTQAKHKKVWDCLIALLCFVLLVICIALIGDYMETKMKVLDQKLLEQRLR